MAQPRIFYYCYDSSHPTGGEKHNYQHVDVLRRNSVEAYALHRRSGFRLEWFENDVPVAYWDEVVFEENRDIIVVPETMALQTRDIPCKKVIFNKNIYYGFAAMGLSQRGPDVYLPDDVVGIISVSQHNCEYLKFAYPSKRVVVVIPDIRVSRFTYRPLTSKRLQIAYATKASTDGRTLYQVLQGRAAIGLNSLHSATWVPIAGLTEAQVAMTLQGTLVLLFLSVHEGLPRLPLEAMASGCLVCAYDFGAQTEYLPAAYRFPYGDILAIARQIESIIGAFPEGLGRYQAVSCEARKIAERYSAAEQEKSVLNAWEQLLTHAGYI